MAKFQFEVKAKENSVSSGVALATGIQLSKGDLLTVNVSPDDTWRFATGNWDSTSNANGLGNPLGSDCGLFTKNGFSFIIGSLVGSLDDGKTFFPIGTRLEMTILGAGQLSLFCWDCNNYDNDGSVIATVAVYKRAN